MPEDYEDTGDDYKSLIYLGIYYAIMMAIGFLGLTWGIGLTEESFITRYLVYSIIMIGGFMFFASVKIARIRGYLPNFFVMIHDPELGLFNKIKFVSNPLYLFLIGTLFTSFLALMATLNSQIAVILFPLQTGVAIQQVLPASGILFSIYAASAENTILYILISIILSLCVWLASQLELPKKYGYYLAIVIAVIFSALLFKNIHAVVSSTDEVASTGHLIFGGLMALAFITTGSILVSDLFHFTNNLFVSIKGVWGSDYLLYTFSIVVGIAMLVFIISLVLSQTKEKSYG